MTNNQIINGKSVKFFFRKLVKKSQIYNSFLSACNVFLCIFKLYNHNIERELKIYTSLTRIFNYYQEKNVKILI